MIDQFNNSSTLAVISPYPSRGETYSKGTTGVASYSKNVVRDIGHDVIVLTDYTKRPETYAEKATLVNRCYAKGSPLMWFDIYKNLSTFTEVKTVLIHFDFSMYGSLLTTAFIIPFLFALKLAGYDVSVVAHHVILDVTKLSGHLGLTGSFVDHAKAQIYNVIFRTFFVLLGLTSHQVIVLEEILKTRLSRFVKSNKIVTIPHAVDTSVTTVSKAAARKKLGIGQDEQVVLFFGFVNWFKGADFFVDTFQNVSELLSKKARFIIAGGKSPTMSDKAFYNTYFDRVSRTVKNSKRVEMTGYIPQEQIKLYFAASDLVVFPYRDLMCASGVLSLTFSYMKPFIVSSELGQMFETDEFREALETVKLDKNKIVFSLDQVDLVTQTTNVLADGIKPKLVKLTKLIREERSFATSAELYKRALFSSVYTFTKTPALGYTK